MSRGLAARLPGDDVDVSGLAACLASIPGIVILPQQLCLLAQSLCCCCLQNRSHQLS